MKSKLRFVVTADSGHGQLEQHFEQKRPVIDSHFSRVTYYMHISKNENGGANRNTQLKNCIGDN
jgi:hypothetical protein